MTKSQEDDSRILLQTGSACHHGQCCAAANAETMSEVLNKSMFYGEPATLCDTARQNQALVTINFSEKLSGFT
jgi:hypothetical protein